MNLYLTTHGQYARTQAEAGKGATKVDVPTDARGLVAYLNGIVEAVNADPITKDLNGIPGSPVEAAPALIMRDPAGIQPDVPLEAPKSAPAASRGAFKLQAGREADQFAEWVLEAPAFAVVNVHSACVERFERMRIELVKGSWL